MKIVDLTKVKDLEKRNAMFRKMSKKERRLAIARDVLAQLKAGKYKAQCGVYVQVPGRLGQKLDDSNFENLQEVLDAKAPTCTVCGIGAAFMSRARLGNDSDDTDFHGHLEEDFSTAQLGMIESAFECDEYFGGFTQCAVKARAFGHIYLENEDRLRAIFQNILDNDGTFKP